MRVGGTKICMIRSEWHFRRVDGAVGRLYVVTSKGGAACASLESGFWDGWAKAGEMRRFVCGGTRTVLPQCIEPVARMEASFCKLQQRHSIKWRESGLISKTL
jgi:hypothetical protein